MVTPVTHNRLRNVGKKQRMFSKVYIFKAISVLLKQEISTSLTLFGIIDMSTSSKLFFLEVQSGNFSLYGQIHDETGEPAENWAEAIFSKQNFNHDKRRPKLN